METRIIFVALVLFILFGMAMVQAQGWEDDWSDSSGYEYDSNYTCCGPTFILLALGLAHINIFKHF